MVEVPNHHHTPHQEPLYGPYYAGKGSVDNHLAPFSRTALGCAGARSPAERSLPPPSAHAPEDGHGCVGAPGTVTRGGLPPDEVGLESLGARRRQSRSVSCAV